MTDEMPPDPGGSPSTEPAREPTVDPRRPPDPTVAALRGQRNPVRVFAAILGPGLVTGASDDDPSGIGTYAQAGAAFGYATLWTTLVMLPMMISVQYICAKIGLVSGRGLGGVLREHYPRWVLYPAVISLVVANTINAGVDIGAIAAAVSLFVPIRAIVFVVPISVGIVALQVFGTYRSIARVFRWLAMALLAYIAAALLSRPDWGDVLRGTFVPTIQLTPQYIGILVALLGTTISPYLFFWQANQEVDEQIAMGRGRLWQRQGASRTELRYALADTVTGMVFSEVVAYFIILASGATLYAAGQHDASSATELAQALRPVAGDLSVALLAVGLIGAGVLAVPVLPASAAYGVSEAFGWRSGLNHGLGRAPQFYTVIGLATIAGMSIDLLGIDPIAALVATAVINGLLAAPLLVLVMLVSNDRRVMGERTNGRRLNLLGWGTTAVMAVAAIALVVITIVG